MFPSIFRNMPLRNGAGIQVFNNYHYIFLLVVCLVIFWLHAHICPEAQVWCHRSMTLSCCHVLSASSWPQWLSLTLQRALGGCTWENPEWPSGHSSAKDWWLYKGIPVFTAGTGTCVLHRSWVDATGSLKCFVNSLKDDRRGACSPSFPSEYEVHTPKVPIFFYDLNYLPPLEEGN